MKNPPLILLRVQEFELELKHQERKQAHHKPQIQDLKSMILQFLYVDVVLLKTDADNFAFEWIEDLHDVKCFLLLNGSV